MNLKQLEAFVRVAETKSFSVTAKQLYLTQPTVSAHIASLEKELNACLLVRNTKGVELSETGKELYAYAEQMLELERKIKERFGLDGRSAGSVLRVAASTVPAQYLLPDIMAVFLKNYPDEQIKIMESDSAGVIEMIRTHRADIGFTGTVIERGNCTYFPFYQDELVLITPMEKRFLERKERGENISRWIGKEPFIMREEGSGTRKEAEKILSSRGINLSEFNVAAVVENPETVDVDATTSASVLPSGNAARLAGWIQEEVGGDLFSIVTTEPYSSNYDECLDRAAQEKADNARPELVHHVENMEDYDIVF